MNWGQNTFGNKIESIINEQEAMLKFLEEFKKENMLLHVWTVNEEKDMKLLYENQIDSIITNYPDVARKIINQ